MLAFITEVHPTLLLFFVSDLDGLIRVLVVVVSRRVHILAVVVPLREYKEDSEVRRKECHLFHEEGRTSHDPAIGP